MSHDIPLWHRVVGVGVLAAGLFTYDPSNTNWAHQLGIPMMFAFAMWLLTHALLAVALTCLTLGLLNTDIHASHWIASIAYPVFAGVSFITTAYLLWQRFTKHIKSTHAQRWQHRGEPHD
ncbi:MAG: hypothetical protein GXP16_05535 [Gammaproteobacteria bacterium]|nr:hypothetical protein [Gammaproteobacteria bacterium]